MQLTNQTYWTKSAAELRFIMKDAAEAEQNVRNFDAKAAAKYSEQICDAGTVLAARERERAAA